MNEKLRILIVEDEAAIRNGLVDLFVFHGYDVESADDGAVGLECALVGSFDLVILDVMLPNVDGFTICNRLRERSRAQAIILLTAKSTDEDIIQGLSLGADDYIAKPFSVRQLVLRAEAVLRRSARVVARERKLLLGSVLEIDTLNLTGIRLETGDEIVLTRREVDILAYLVAHSDRPVSRDELLSEVWGYARAEAIDTRTVDIHIAKLRRKIEPNPKSPAILETVRGEGYRLKLNRDGET